MLTLVLRPHAERGGHHLDRFDAYLDGKLLVTSRQPRLDGARTLLEMGYGPDVLLTTRRVRLGQGPQAKHGGSAGAPSPPEGRAYDSFKPAPIGELAKWTLEETERVVDIRSATTAGRA